ncbi:uncharacterized protein LOC110426108 [Herrania umbratica]|uniref:Uncharacterized protein LOC110426108 n=1 Tax=Herrania umbratica TaxID=108875 RepID=A0A6J1BBY5_9ROSI|nr:uncharacterized protein LOC110426108 [Herrania umbratica]
MATLKFLLFSLGTLAILQGTYAVLFKVTNNAASTQGGVRFINEIGVQYSTRSLRFATATVWRLLGQLRPAERKNVKQVSLFIDVMDGVAYESDNEIHLSANYIGNYSRDVKREFTGILVHETAHVWQWNGNGQTPGGLIEGIADFIRLKAGYAPPHWVTAGQGDKWDQGYDITAWFLNYCDSLSRGFVAKLNRKMKSSYSSDYFVELLGKNVDKLWSDYKAKYKT